MVLTVEVPDNAKDVKISVLCDGKECCSTNPRYRPGYWNGLNGGTHYGQYFDMYDADRVNEMLEVAFALKEYGVGYILTKMKRNYRIMITKNNYFGMDEELRKRIRDINTHYDSIRQ